MPRRPPAWPGRVSRSARRPPRPGAPRCPSALWSPPMSWASLRSGWSSRHTAGMPTATPSPRTRHGRPPRPSR
eukprot:8247380-Alexandrium_andersonii.AAC.1